MRLVLSLAAMLLCATTAGACGSEPAPNASDRFFGIAPQDFPSDPEITRMARGGVGSQHVLIAWSRVEKVEGVYDWQLYDGLLTALAEEGTEPIPYLFATPAIYEEKATVPPVRSEETFDAWASFVKAAVSRYSPDGEFWKILGRSRPDIAPMPASIWEIWNEMNGPTFWDPVPDVSEYAKLLKRTSRVIEGVDPDARVMTGGMFATPTSEDRITSFKFLRQLYKKRGMAQIIDAVGVHPYGPNVASVELQMDRTREVIDRADDASMFVTEIGWGSDEGVGGQLAKDPDRQAELLTDSFEKFLDRREEWDLEGVLWYSWRDPLIPPPACTWCPAAGLFDRDLDPKPAWDAYVELAGGES